MFLILDDTAGSGMLDLEKVFVLDAASRSVAREEVVRLASSDNLADVVLRIRCLNPRDLSPKPLQ